MALVHRKRMSTFVALIVAALFATGCGGAEARKAKYLEKGKNYLEQKNYDKAAVELRNVLQIDPKHAEAYELLGKAVEEKGDLRQAFGYYNRAVELDPKLLAARYALGRIFLVVNQPTDAMSQAEAILAIDPADRQGRYIRAAVLARQNNRDEALKLATAIVAEDPAHVEAVALLAGLYFASNRNEEALKALEQGVAAAPDNNRLRILLARYYADRNDTAQVTKLMQEAIAREPDRVEHAIALAAYYAQHKMPAEAEATIRAAVERDEKDPRRHLLLAQYLARANSPAAAERSLLDSIKRLPDARELRFALVELYVVKRERPKAEAILRDMIKDQGKKPDGLKARSQLAALLIDSGKKDEGKKLIKEVLDENPRDNQALMLDATVALSEKDALRAITSLREVVKDQPNSVEALTLLANAHLMNNETGLAKENLQKAVDANPKDARTRLALAQFYVSQKDFDGALKEIERSLADNKDHFASLMAKAQLFSTRQDSKRLEATLVQIRTAHPDKPEGYVRLGQFYGSQKKYDAARREFEAAIEKFPDVGEVLTGITATYVAQNQPDKALKRLGDVVAANPGNALAHRLTAEILISQRKTPEAEQALKRAIAAQPKWNQPYMDLASLKLATNDLSGALAITEEGIKVLPDDLLLQTRLAEIHDRSGNADKAIAVYEGMLKKNPNNPLAANNLASLLVDRKGDAASVKRAIEIASRFETSDQPAFVDTLGWAYYNAGSTQKAVDLLKRAADKAPKVPVFQYHLGLAYAKLGDKAAAQKHLEKTLELAPKFAKAEEIRTALAGLK